jgi:hypothetical protein
MSSIIDKFRRELGFQGHQSNYNVDGKTWTGYHSCKYGNSVVDYTYKLAPFYTSYGAVGMVKIT